ncbi:MULTISPECIES: hypothetical protein [unclassified Pseudoalteromonas]|uniref:hypothetical protein n=1 Tax=unclassified Pseudoalteromonas TaxID=194690 RepID=UPI0005A7C928|nr:MULTISPECIES: hypothetical protein [unclassified Pseudoalteromonas]
MSIISNQLPGINSANHSDNNISKTTSTSFKLFEVMSKQPDPMAGFGSDEISDNVQSLYRELGVEVQQTMDSSLEKREYDLSYFNKVIKEITEVPIKVEVERHEMKDAILFARLGIDFLKVKEIEVKIDMLTLTGQDIESSSALTQSDKDILRERINDLKVQLEEQKAALMKGETPEELEPFKALDFKQADEINPLYNQIQDSNKYLF